MTTARNFQPIAGVPATDADIDAFALRRGVPTLTVTPTPTPTPAVERSPVGRINFQPPDYLAEDLRIRAIKERCSVRYLVLKALHASGYFIRDEDMQSDGRRLR